MMLLVLGILRVIKSFKEIYTFQKGNKQWKVVLFQWIKCKCHFSFAPNLLPQLWQFNTHESILRNIYSRLNTFNCLNSIRIYLNIVTNFFTIHYFFCFCFQYIHNQHCSTLNLALCSWDTPGSFFGNCRHIFGCFLIFLTP